MEGLEKNWKKRAGIGKIEKESERLGKEFSNLICTPIFMQLSTISPYN